MVVAILTTLAIVGFLRGRGRTEYERRLASLQAAGEPVNQADLARLYPDPPPERDFRRLLRSILPPGSSPAADPQMDTGQVFTDLRSLGHERALPPELMAVVREEWKTNAPVVELLLRTDLAEFGFKHDWATRGFLSNQDLEGDKIFLRINLCRVLIGVAAYEAQCRHPERAGLTMVRGLQVARLPSRIGLISIVGQLACENIMLSAVNRALARGELGEPELAALAAVLPRARDTLREGLEAERALNIWCHDSATLRKRGLGFQGSGLFSNPWLAKAHLQSQLLVRGYSGRLRMLDRWEERLKAVQLPVPAQLQAIQLSQSNVFLKLNQRGGSTAQVRAAWDLDFCLMGLLEPKLDACFRENALVLAALANAQAVVAIERWRLAHAGQLPGRLEEVVPAYLPAVPLDPFDGQPVRFRRLPQGYMVYCIGLDFTDDGGAEGGRGENPGSDTTLRVLR